MMLKVTFLEIFELILVFSFHILLGFCSQHCDPSDLQNPKNLCSPPEICNEKTKLCECHTGYILKGNKCVIDESIKPDNSKAPNSSSLIDQSEDSGVATAVLIPLSLIIALVVGVYLGRKYNVFTWVRNRLRRKNTNYDEFMIGQDVDDDDDPPLH